MNSLFLFALPLAAATTCFFVRSSTFQLWLARSTALTMVVVSAGLVFSASTKSATSTAVHFGGWAPPLGVAFQIDRLSALFCLLLSIVLFSTLSVLPRVSPGKETSEEGDRLRRILPYTLFLGAALAGAFSTTDLFNLFVLFELVLISSYLLLQGSGPKARREAAPYIVTNVVASLLFFIGAGMLYTIGGSLSIPHLAADPGWTSSPWANAGVGLLAIAFATKAGLVPLMFWLPRTYRHLFGPIGALFAGMMTKLGVYALLRITPLMAETNIPEVLLWAGAISAILGVLAAQAQVRFRDLLCFHIVSQVGFMVVGIGMATVAGLAGAIFYVAHHVLVKTALFLIADMSDPDHPSPIAAEASGQSGRRSRWLPLAFLIAGLSLAGLPPLSGFVGKVAVFQALIATERYAVIAILVVASLFTLVSVLKLWRAGFRRPAGSRNRTDRQPAHTVPFGVAVLIVVSLVLTLAGGPSYRYAEAAAEEILSTGTPSTEVQP